MNRRKTMKPDKKNTIFLLGGYDLEMIEIKSLLLAENYMVKDRKLSWDNAKLSNYVRFFNRTSQFVGIELQEDVKRPLHYKLIDHHNENAHMPSAIEQVADLIGVKLTKEQQLIAANDKGYIPAMKALGATDDEIADIRRRDRAAQGVTEEDERSADESIKNNLVKVGDVVLINSTTNHFSAVVDKTYHIKDKIIYNDFQIVQYGKDDCGFSVIIDTFKMCGVYYHGGGVKGYKGFTTRVQGVIIQIVKQITLNNMTKHSYHVFLFPFKIEKQNGKNEALTYDERMKDFWDFEPNEGLLGYNEKKYFYPYVHESIFNTENNSENFVQNYVYKKTSGLKYKIKVNKKNLPPVHESLFRDESPKPSRELGFESCTYELDIVKVSLQINKLDVGVLAIHLVNQKYKLPYDILMINQFGRRLYPPFFDLHYNSFSKVSLSTPLDGTKHRELADSIQIVKTTDDRSGVERFNDFFENEKIIPKHIAFFLKSTPYINTITPAIDDRMFVMCWYGNEQLSYKTLKLKLTKKQEREKYKLILSDICKVSHGGYESSGFHRDELNHKTLSFNKTHSSYGYALNPFWYQYVFVDGYGMSCANKNLQIQQIEQHTYARWVENNTIFGITRHSFVCLSEPEDELNRGNINAGFIVDHMSGLYVRMVTYVLSQRALVLKYSKDASDQCKKLNKKNISDKKNRKKVLEDVEGIILEYSIFVNSFFNREVTAQEQGIELYSMLQDHLRIENQLKELEKEIDQLHKNSTLIIERKNNAFIDKLTILATVLAIPALVFEFAQTQWLNIYDCNELNSFYAYLDYLCGKSTEFDYGILFGSFSFIIFMILHTYHKLIRDKCDEDESIIKKFRPWFTTSLSILIYILIYPILNYLSVFALYCMSNILLSINLLIKKTNNDV